MPLLAAGTWQYNDTEAEASVIAAVKVGFTMVDTAYDYHNQAGVGRALRSEGVDRKSIFLETKVPGCGLDPAVSTSRCYEDTKKVLEEDLTLLNQSYVDVVIVHFPPLGSMLMRTCQLICGEVRDQWAAMEEFYKAGKAKAIGVSNYCPSCFECLDGNATVYPMVNQVGYHLGMGPDPSGFKRLADEKGVVLQAYSPLGNKPWKKGADPEILTGKFTSSLATAHNVSTIQVALKWLVEHGVPTVTKSSNPKHLASDLDLWSWNLTEAEMTAADKFSIFGIPSFACNFEDELVV
jgi:diketogulonate reductase-like aldo/keto reductase